MKYNGLVISDIHVGASDLHKLNEELNELFIDKINTMKDLDFVIVCGDFFDHKFYLNSNEATMAYLILRNIIYACKNRNIKLRFVYGTESHECNQYDIMNLLQLYDGVRVIKTVEEEELLPDLNILYLPEEYIVNKNSYYKDYFSNVKKYDYIFGHGVIREVMKEFALKIKDDDDDKNKRKKAPVFASSELLSICKGQIYFGHYHMNEEYENKIFSISSFSRWRFGEEKRKGFYHITCNTDKHKYNQEFIENTLADEYKTVRFGYDNDIFKSEDRLKEKIDEVENIINRNPYKHMKVVFNIPKDNDNPEAIINYISERLKYKDNFIKSEFTNGYIEERNKIKKENYDKESKEYSFIFEDIPIEDKVHLFIKSKYEKDIPANIISDYLFKSFDDLIK